jgi:hypothetical protein
VSTPRPCALAFDRDRTLALAMSDDEVVETQPCPFCEELFGIGPDLIRHVATHLGEPRGSPLQAVEGPSQQVTDAFQ